MTVGTGSLCQHSFRSTREGRTARKIPRQADYGTGCPCLAFDVPDYGRPPDRAGQAEVVVNRRQHKVAGCAGILFVVLFAAGIVVSGNSPALNASAAKITLYYQDHHAGILVSELLINLASVVLLWFLGGLHAILRQRDERGLLAPVVLAAGIATVAAGMVSDLAGTVAGLLAAQHSLGDPSLTRALLDINTGAHPAFLPLTVLTATLAAATLQGAIGARWVGWLNVLTSAACLVSAVIGSLDADGMVPPLGLLGFFIVVIALSVSMLRDRSPAAAAGPASRQAEAAHQ
jgi:hypothetical protein